MDAQGTTIEASRQWYEPLLARSRASVESALREVREVFGGDPWAVPRTGLGGALALHVARAYGTRSTRRNRKMAVASLEAWNQRVHRRDRPALRRSLARDARDWMRLFGTLVRRTDDAGSRAAARLMPLWSSEQEVPEGVMFMRASVAAGVVLGGAADEVHAQLDTWATWSGIAWEARQGALTEEGMCGALCALGAAPGTLASLPAASDERVFTHAAAAARSALASLPQTHAREVLGALVERLPLRASSPREPRAWSPHLAPVATPSRRALSGQGAWARFAQAQRDPLEAALRATVCPAPRAMQSSIDYLLGQGGKRVRPMMTLSAARACAGEPKWALPEAALVEWLHQTSLVLDDVIDDASLRRGHPSLHCATSTEFAASASLFLLGRLHTRVLSMPRRSRELVADAVALLAEGEWEETQHTHDAALDATTYYRIIEAKTARLFSCAAALGASAAGASGAHVRAAARAGREAGLAFQIVDDLLDLLGDEAALGKAPGTDLRAGKTTLPLILTRRALRGQERERLEALLSGRVDDVDAHRAWVVARCVASGAAEACRARVRAHSARAAEAIAALPDAQGRALFADLVAELVERQS